MHCLLLVILVVGSHVLVFVSIKIQVDICTVLSRIDIHVLVLIIAHDCSTSLVAIVSFWVLDIDTDLGRRGLLLLSYWLGVWWLNSWHLLHWWLHHTRHLQVRVVHLLLLVIVWLHHWHHWLHRSLHVGRHFWVWSQCRLHCRLKSISDIS